MHLRHHSIGGSRPRRRQIAILVALALTWSLSPAQDGQPAPTVEPVMRRTNVFPGKDADAPRETEYLLAVKLPRAFKGRLAWRFVIGSAPVQAREVPITVAAARTERVKLLLRVPYVRAGLVVEGKLTAHLIADDQDRPTATYEQPLWIFPQEPFGQRAQWLKELKITLFDPRETTAPILKRMEIPFEEIHNVAALEDLKEGLLLVGEGVSFEEERALPEILLKVAARGLPVLCLAPAKGMLPLPGADNNALPPPQSVAFQRAEVITRLDKRLDARGWLPDGKVIAAGLALKAVEGSVVGEVTDGTSGWPWLEVRYPKQGRLVVCGFGLMNHWEASPTPRYLFARVLESLTTGQKTELGK